MTVEVTTTTTATTPLSQQQQQRRPEWTKNMYMQQSIGDSTLRNFVRWWVRLYDKESTKLPWMMMNNNSNSNNSNSINR